jgi:hypothetical protein
VPVALSNRFRNLPITDQLAGTWVGATRTLTGMRGGDLVALQVRVWDLRYGSTFNEAAMNPASGNQYGVSCPFSYLICASGCLPPGTDYIHNFRSFSLVTNPPPGVLMIRQENAYTGSCLQQVFLGMHNVDAAPSIDAGWQAPGQQFSPFIDLQYTNLNTRFYRLHDGDTFSSNAVGYYRLPICAGFSLVANPFDTPGGNLVANVFKSPPNNTQVYKFGGNYGGYNSITFWGSVWGWEGDDVLMTLSPGEGLFVYASVPFTNTFLGSVPLSANVPITSGFSIISSPFPRSGLLDAMPPGGLGFAVRHGDQIFQWNCTGRFFLSNSYLDGQWEGDDGGAQPFIALGEAFFFYNAGPARTWNGVYCVCP